MTSKTILPKRYFQTSFRCGQIEHLHYSFTIGFFPTAYDPLLTTHCLLHTAYYILSTTYYLLHTVRYRLLTTYYPLQTTYCPLIALFRLSRLCETRFRPPRYLLPASSAFTAAWILFRRKNRIVMVSKTLPSIFHGNTQKRSSISKGSACPGMFSAILAL